MTSTLIALAILAAPSAVAQPGNAGWFTDYDLARAEAKKTGKPLLVVFRCQPCPDSKEIDGQLQRLHPDLGDALKQFVRVRFTTIAGKDLRVFDFDYDLTWAVLLMNSDETIYGRYGLRDASDPDSRHTLAGLRFALERALEQHKAPPKANPRDGVARKVENFAAAKRHRGCIHCHNVKEFDRAERKKANTWNREEVWVYPLPENLGLTLGLDQGNRVKAVAAKSVAADAGIRVGDSIQTLNGVRVSSHADFSYGLHRAPAAGKIPVTWTRNGELQSGQIIVAAGWRKANNTWRPSMLDLLPFVPFSGENLNDTDRKALGIQEGMAAYRQDQFLHSSLREGGVQKHDIVVGLDGKKIAGKLNELSDYLRREYIVGDEVVLNVLRDGKPTEVKIRLK